MKEDNRIQRIFQAYTFAGAINAILATDDYAFRGIFAWLKALCASIGGVPLIPVRRKIITLPAIGRFLDARTRQCLCPEMIIYK